MGQMYAPEALQKLFSGLHTRALQLASWGDATVARAVSVAFTAMRAPITVPMAVFHFSVGLYPVQCFILKPLQLLQVSVSVSDMLSLLPCNPPLVLHVHSAAVFREPGANAGRLRRRGASSSYT